MGVTPRGINYEEIKPPQFRYSREGISATRTLKIAWEDIERFAAEAFPAGAVTNGGNIIPATQTFPGKSYLILSNLDVTPFDEENPQTNDSYGVATCDSGATVTLSYETQSFTEGQPLGGDDEEGLGLAIFSHALQIGGEYYSLPANAVSWTQAAFDPFNPPSPDAEADTNQFDNLQAAKLIPIIEHVITLYRVPELPMEAIREKIGRVNLNYDNLFDAEAETLLFMGANATRKVTTEGADAWEIEYRFSQRLVWQGEQQFQANGDPVKDGDGDPVFTMYARGWNDFIDPATGLWRTLYLKNGDKIYATTEDFLALFNPDADIEQSSSSS